MGIKRDENISVTDQAYELYAEITYKIAMKYSANHYIAEEIVQEAFLKLHFHENHVDVENAGKWLAITVKNMALNYLRDSKKECPIDELVYDESETGTDQLDNPEILLLKKEKDAADIALLDEIFNELYVKNIRWYDAIMLTYVLGKPQKDAADEMGVTMEVFHSMLYRARQWIRKNYGEKYMHLDSP